MGELSQEDQEHADKLARLEQQAHQGALFEDWIRHQAGQIFLKFLEEQVTDSKNKWLSADDRNGAEIVRVQAQVYQKIKQWIAAQIASGKLASNEVTKFVQEGEKLEGWIKDQSSKVRPE
jgi:hypothetical protein